MCRCEADGEYRNKRDGSCKRRRSPLTDCVFIRCNGLELIRCCPSAPPSRSTLPTPHRPSSFPNRAASSEQPASETGGSSPNVQPTPFDFRRATSRLAYLIPHSYRPRIFFGTFSLNKLLPPASPTLTRRHARCVTQYLSNLLSYIKRYELGSVPPMSDMPTSSGSLIQLLGLRPSSTSCPCTSETGQ